jgi:hypothetical protein
VTRTNLGRRSSSTSSTLSTRSTCLIEQAFGKLSGVAPASVGFATNLAERFPALAGVPASDRTLPVLQPLDAILPAIQRGTTVGTTGQADVSLALALAAGPSAEGAWVGVAGLPELGIRAAAEMGIALERLVIVRGDAPWIEVLAAMIDGFDVVLIGPAVGRVAPGAVRRLQARAQQRGAVLITAGSSPFAADLQLSSHEQQWVGLGAGHGVATGRHVCVELGGRRVPRGVSRPGRITIWLPDATGRAEAVIGASVLGGAELRHQVLTGGHRRVAG